MGGDETRGRRGDLPWARLAAIVVLTLAWIASIPFSFLYVFTDDFYGPIGDGSSMGYERVRAVGLAYGCIVFQTIHRTQDVGWQVKKTEGFHLRFLMVRENVEGWWRITSSGLSLLVLILGIAATLIPWWGHRRQARRADGVEVG